MITAEQISILDKAVIITVILSVLVFMIIFGWLIYAYYVQHKKINIKGRGEK